MAYNFQSPGAAATTAIREVLAQRALEKRQAMMDQLNIDNTEHGWGIENANLKINQDANTRAGEMQEHTITEDLLKSLPQTRTDLSQFKDPRIVTALQGRGLVGQRPGEPTVVEHEQEAPTENTGEVPTFKSSSVQAPVEQYIGSKETQLAEDARARLEAAVKAISANPNMTNLERQASLVGAGGMDAIHPSATQGKSTFRVLAPNFRGIIDVPEGQQVEMGNYPPTPPAAYAPQLYQVTPPTGGPPSSAVLTLEEARRLAAQGNTLRDGNLPAGDGSGPAATLVNRLTQSRGVYESAKTRAGKSFFFGEQKRTPELDGAEAQYRNALGAVFNATGAAPDLQQLAMDIAMHPETSNKSVQELLRDNNIVPDQFPDPTDLQTLDMLLNYTRGAVGSSGAAPITSGPQFTP